MLQPKDIDAVESQRQERIQAAKRIKRSRSAHSYRSYSVDSHVEEETSTCLPRCFRHRQRSDHDQLYRSRNDTSISDFPSPDSNPPSYEGMYAGGDLPSRSWSSNTKSLHEDSLDHRDERTAILIDLAQQRQRYVLIIADLCCDCFLGAAPRSLDIFCQVLAGPRKGTEGAYSAQGSH